MTLWEALFERVETTGAASRLLDHLGHDAGAHSLAALSEGEAQALLPKFDEALDDADSQV